MSVIVRRAVAGTLESSDALVEIEPCGELRVELDSVVEAQYGDSIRQSIRNVLAGLGVEAARVRVTDRGALDCVIRARVETAVLRGGEAEDRA